MAPGRWPRGGICRRPYSGPRGLGLRWLGWRHTLGPQPSRVPAGPTAPSVPSLQPRQHSPSWRHSDAGALFPESTWLACPQGPALPKQSGTRTRAPPPVGNVVASGLGGLCRALCHALPRSRAGQGGGPATGRRPSVSPRGEAAPGSPQRLPRRPLVGPREAGGRGGGGSGRHFSPAGTKTVPVKLPWPGHRPALFSAPVVASFPLLTGHEGEE